MTGTGIQADPYIVDTWDDFVTAVGKENVYVKIPDNTIWDMDNILPSGLTSSVTVKCSEIEGNFAKIRNIRVSAKNIFSFYASTNVNRLNLLNITDTTYNDDRSWFSATTNGGGGTTSFKNCAITGLITSGCLAKGNDFLGIRFTNDETNGCAINLQFGGDAVLGGSYVSYSNSLIEFGGKSTASDIYFTSFNNCYIQGKCPWDEIIIKSAAPNVFDIGFSRLSCDNSSSASSKIYKQNIVNQEKIATLGDNVKNLTLVTEAQLHDAEYLKSVGFPIL